MSSVGPNKTHAITKNAHANFKNRMRSLFTCAFCKSHTRLSFSHANFYFRMRIWILRIRLQSCACVFFYSHAFFAFSHANFESSHAKKWRCHRALLRRMRKKNKSSHAIFTKSRMRTYQSSHASLFISRMRT